MILILKKTKSNKQSMLPKRWELNFYILSLQHDQLDVYSCHDITCQTIHMPPPPPPPSRFTR